MFWGIYEFNVFFSMLQKIMFQFYTRLKLARKKKKINFMWRTKHIYSGYQLQKGHSFIARTFKNHFPLFYAKIEFMNQIIHENNTNNNFGKKCFQEKYFSHYEIYMYKNSFIFSRHYFTSLKYTYLHTGHLQAPLSQLSWR